MACRPIRLVFDPPASQFLFSNDLRVISSSDNKEILSGLIYRFPSPMTVFHQAWRRISYSFSSNGDFVLSEGLLMMIWLKFTPRQRSTCLLADVFVCLIGQRLLNWLQEGHRKWVFIDPAFKLQTRGDFPECCTKGFFFFNIRVCFYTRVCVYMWNRGGRGGDGGSTGRPPVRMRAEERCVREACDCVCARLNYLAQRPDRGVNEVRSSLLQRFSSLHPSISTPSTHQLPFLLLFVLLRRCRAPRLFCLS